MNLAAIEFRLMTDFSCSFPHAFLTVRGEQSRIKARACFNQPETTRFQTHSLSSFRNNVYTYFTLVTEVIQDSGNVSLRECL